ncbi:MAG: hypothetical protein LBJ95_04790 [Oscillospiraceae bacterium]|jgi:hypothetical protein|nr:hypothetical protein [Oscillospiraceae bacterium]
MKIKNILAVSLLSVSTFLSVPSAHAVITPLTGGEREAVGNAKLNYQGEYVVLLLESCFGEQYAGELDLLNLPGTRIDGTIK